MTLTGNGTNTQKAYRIKKSLRELVQKPRPKQRKFSITLPPLPHNDHIKEELAYDVLYECQRGSLLVGYSSKTLLQFDPNPWCDGNMSFTPMDISNYQLPDPMWEWVSENWMIDMTEDVDEAGWQYAFNFHGAVWRGNYKHIRSFARRRRWIRLRRLPQITIVQPVVTKHDLIDVEHLSIPDTLLHRLKKCRLDRERLSVFNSYDYDLQLLEKVDEYVKLFDFESSKYKFLSHFFTKKYYSGIKQVSLNETEIKAIQSLRFHRDRQNILNIIS
ncbi:hypothetical protein MFLAVUS_008880 [Mucor flavus]|uniref:Peroxin/Ferlin domain-containing protein n=1 Tax=Mucor flavus TaxID=439312 RepID=A0ABP9Z8E7_9FUNG